MSGIIGPALVVAVAAGAVAGRRVRARLQRPPARSTGGTR